MRRSQPTISKRTQKASLSLQVIAILLTFYVEGAYLDTLSALPSSILVNIGWASFFCVISIFFTLVFSQAASINNNSKKSASLNFYMHSIIIGIVLSLGYAFGASEMNQLQTDASGALFLAIAAFCTISAPAALLLYFMPESKSLKREKEQVSTNAAKIKAALIVRLNPNSRNIVSRTTWIGAWVTQELLTVFCFISFMAFAGDFSTFDNVRYGILSSYPSLLVSFLLMIVPLFMGAN